MTGILRPVPERPKGPIVRDMSAATKTRVLTVQGWMGKQCTVTLTGGTLKEAKREAHRQAAGLLPYAGRTTVVRVEVV